MAKDEPVLVTVLMNTETVEKARTLKEAESAKERIRTEAKEELEHLVAAARARHDRREAIDLRRGRPYV